MGMDRTGLEAIVHRCPKELDLLSLSMSEREAGNGRSRICREPR